MSQFNDGMFRDSNLKIRNVTQAQFDAQKVNFNPDVIYRVDGVFHLPDVNTETYASAVTATRDASGNVVGLGVAGVSYPIAVAWGSKPLATAVAPGTNIFVTDVGIGGSFWYSDGSRWRCTSSILSVLAPAPVLAGQLYAVGGAEALFGSAVKVPAGVLSVGDNIRLIATATHPTSGTAARTINLRMSSDLASILTGAKAIFFSQTSASTIYMSIDKFATFTTATVARGASQYVPTSATQTTNTQYEVTVPTIASDTFFGITATPSADTSILMFSASVYVEFAS